MDRHHSVASYGRVLGAALVVLCASVFATQGLAAEKKPVQVGTVTMEQLQIAFIGSANFGDGKLHFQGKTHPFQVSGLGIGGIGISTIDARGEVYDMKNTADFPGLYVQARAGIVLGTVGKGGLWLENNNGVYIRLTAKRKGLALSLGADGVVITMDK